MKTSHITFCIGAACAVVFMSIAQAAPTGGAKNPEQCAKDCSTTWEKKFKECNGIKECETFCSHELRDCLKQCEKR